MARKLSVNVIVEDENRQHVVLEAGSEVPSWASDQVGDHCFDEPADKAPAKKKPARSSS